MKQFLPLCIFATLFFTNSNAQSLQPADAQLAAVISPSVDAACNTSYTPRVVVRNAGVNTIQNFQVGYSLDNGPIVSRTFTKFLSFNQRDTATLASFAALAGQHTFQVFIMSVNGQPDVNPNNDVAFRTFDVLNRSAVPFPVAEGFEANGFPPQGWQVINPDQSNFRWRRAPFVALSGIGSAFKDNFNDPNIGTEDHVLTPFLDFVDPTLGYFATFAVAYAPTLFNNSDELRISASSDCGLTWTPVYSKVGQALASAPAQSGYYTPGGTGQWRKDSVDLSDFAGEDDLRLRFTVVNGGGNNIYIDDVNINTYARQPIAAFSLSSDTVCIDENLDLNNESSFADSYLWTMPDAAPPVSNLESPTITYSDTGYHTIRLLAVNGAGVDTAFHRVYVRAGNSATITSLGLLLSTTQPFPSYQWYRNGSPIGGATARVFEATRDGIYTVKVGGLTTCIGFSNAISFNALGLSNTGFSNNDISISPNPARGSFTIKQLQPDGKPMQVALFNSIGQQMMKLAVDKVSIVNIEQLVPGLYVLKITQGNLTITEKLMVE